MPLRILVAEDVPVNQQMMRVMLGRMAYAADFADNGLEALRALERRQYDLIFMDMQMPEMDGLECTRQVVRRYPPEHRPKIVALTANVTAEDARECMAAGMDDFLTKPIKAVELRKCLERWGRQRAAGRPANSGPPTRMGMRRPMEDPTPDEAPAPPEPAVQLIDEDVLADLREIDRGEPGVPQSFIDGFSGGRAGAP